MVALLVNFSTAKAIAITTAVIANSGRQADMKPTIAVLAVAKEVARLLKEREALKADQLITWPEVAVPNIC